MNQKKNFIWGAATSAYQIEGGWNEDGRGWSIWDEFCRLPGKTAGASGDFAGGHYHHWREDIGLMKEMGINAYRFSISWPRIIPDLSGRTNEPGLRFYDELIDALLDAGIEPWVTLYHWDLPLCLQRHHGGWLSAGMVEPFVRYASCCFDRYGDRVKNWITINEPWCVAVLGHGFGTHAPGRASQTEPWAVGHHLLLAHAQTVDLYRDIYQPAQGGQIGLVMNCDWREPLSPREEDRQAAELALEYMLGWFADPVYSGDYPRSMRERLGDALPRFTEAEKERLKGSSDFFGLNHYSTYYARAVPPGGPRAVGNGGVFGTDEVELIPMEGVPRSAMNWAIVPWGMNKLLHWIDWRYGGPPIYITENGVAGREVDRETALNDTQRCKFFTDYVAAGLQACGEGVDLRGYFAWCLLDTFEWAWGFDVQFGLIHVDMQSGERIPKKSFYTYRDMIAGQNGIPPGGSRKRIPECEAWI